MRYNAEAKALMLVVPTYISPLIVAAMMRLSKPKSAPKMAYINCAAAGLFFGIAVFHVLSETLEEAAEKADPTQIKPLLMALSAGVVFMLCLDKGWIGAHAHTHDEHEDEDEHQDDGSNFDFDSGEQPSNFSESERIQRQRRRTHQSSVISNADEGWTIFEEDATKPHIIIPVSMIGSLPGINKAINEMKKTRSLIVSTYLAFCFHSLTAGFAMGSQRVSTGMVLIVLLFVFHKSLDAVAVSTQLVRMRIGMIAYWNMMLAFSCMAPAGILLSMHIVKKVTFLVSIMACFSSGVFVYMSLLHIMDEQLRSRNGSVWLKISFFIVGAIMAYVTSLLGA